MRVCVRGGGRPESETDTPVNIGNGPYRDNGEGVAATPLPYPLWGEGRLPWATANRRKGYRW
jgi:hypothetical protein